ncbi:MAG: YciI family protein [Gemmatimonadota bacterium]|nr:YciI family protein [Gemmatimonadota bacterium]
MKFLLLIYNDTTMVDTMPAQQYDASMRNCLAHADELRQEGYLLESQMLEDVATAKSVRIRGGRQTVVDGPFTETKEVLGGFNLIEAADMEEAVGIAAQFPWAHTGCVEVRPVRDIDAVRRRVGAAARGADVAAEA